MGVVRAAGKVVICLTFGAALITATVLWFDLNLKARADRMAAERAAWVAASTEAERVRILGQVAKRSLDARISE